jgi:excisionase family DNA binding protein
MNMQTDALWTVSELSARWRVAKSTLYDWCHSGYIPHLKVRDCVRFDPAEVEAWLKQHAKPGRVHRVPEVEV